MWNTNISKAAVVSVILFSFSVIVKPLMKHLYLHTEYYSQRLPMSGLFVQKIVGQRDTCLTVPRGQKETSLFFYQTCCCTKTKQCNVSPVLEDKLHLIYSCVSCRLKTAVAHIWNEGLCQLLLQFYLSLPHSWLLFEMCVALFEGITTAAVCVYPSRVADAAKALKAANSDLPVASGTNTQ